MDREAHIYGLIYSGYSSYAPHVFLGSFILLLDISTVNKITWFKHSFGDINKVLRCPCSQGHFKIIKYVQCIYLIFDLIWSALIIHEDKIANPLKWRQKFKKITLSIVFLSAKHKLSLFYCYIFYYNLLFFILLLWKLLLENHIKWMLCFYFSPEEEGLINVYRTIIFFAFAENIYLSFSFTRSTYTKSKEWFASCT